MNKFLLTIAVLLSLGGCTVIPTGYATVSYPTPTVTIQGNIGYHGPYYYYYYPHRHIPGYVPPYAPKYYPNSR